MKAVKFSLAMLAVCIASFAGCSFKTAIYADGTIPIPIMAIKARQSLHGTGTRAMYSSEDSYICKKIKEDLILYIFTNTRRNGF